MRLKIQEHKSGEKFPRGFDSGKGRPFDPTPAKKGGPRTHDTGHRFGKVDGGSGTHFNPKQVSGKMQTHQDGKRFGDVFGGEGTQFNPKKPKPSK